MTETLRPHRILELLIVGVASLLTPVVFVLVSACLIRMTAAPRAAIRPGKLRSFLISMVIVALVSAVVLPFVPLEQAPPPRSTFGWCDIPIGWALACSVRLRGDGAAIVATLVYALVSMAAYRDVAQLDSERSARMTYRYANFWFVLLGFLVSCFANAAFVIYSGFTEHAPSGTASNHVFFILFIGLLAWALYALTRELLGTMVALLR